MSQCPRGTHSLAPSVTHTLGQSRRTHSFTHPLAHSLNHLLPHSLARSLPPSLTHSLARSLTHPSIDEPAVDLRLTQARGSDERRLLYLKGNTHGRGGGGGGWGEWGGSGLDVRNNRATLGTMSRCVSHEGSIVSATTNTTFISEKRCDLNKQLMCINCTIKTIFST